MANIRVRCPACNEELEIDERHEGEEVECGSCFEKFIAKADEPERPSSRRSRRSRRDEDDDDLGEGRPRRRRRRVSSGGGVGGGGGGAAVTSLICGILSLPLGCCWCIGLPVAIVGIVFGMAAMRDPQSKGMATVGVVLSVVGLLFAGGMLVFGLLGKGMAWAPNQFGPPGRRGR